MAVYLEDQVNERLEAASEKKVVFLIGDSIRMGMCETVKQELADAAEVVFPEENCRYSQYIITSLRAWSGLCDPERVVLVQFNCGHWDIAHWRGETESLNDIPTYKNNLARIIRILKKLFPHAKIVFATTTTMHPDGIQGLNRRSDEEIARKAMETLGIWDLADRNLNALSGGQRQKVYIAMALAQDTPVVLLDEPNTFLDISHQKQMMDLAGQLASAVKSVVMVLHDLPLAMEYADVLAVLSRGGVLTWGTPEEVCRSVKLREAFGVEIKKMQTPDGEKYYFK
jgi:ABC-type cobalamin/Fe3+-siderophores transport system ATPase subunit